ncbi:MAG: YraN family protein [Thermaurantiacus sp.]
MSRARAQAERRGRRGEALAAWYLRAHGWRIVARRLRLPMIEVDLVARRGDVLAVVEVKWRTKAEAAQLALQPAALARLRRAAAELAAREAARGRPVSARVDLVALAPGAWPRHIVDVR